MKHFDIVNKAFDKLYAEVKQYINENGGSIITYPKDNDNDTIYGYEIGYYSTDEYIVGAVRVHKGNIQVCHISPNGNEYIDTLDEIDDCEWTNLRNSEVFYVPTLYNIAECIEEY